MAFKIPGEDKLPNSPIELFEKLKSLEQLKDSQVNILNEYQSLTAKNEDIAIALPTGYGKTLIGGLIAEYKRKVSGYKVVYCCATRQLAYQTNTLLNSYGIDSVLLTGPGKEFSTKAMGRYFKNKTIVVTTYSHIFNINSKFKNSDLIVFDDAHATQYAIDNLWDMKIDRESQLFNVLFSVLEGTMSENLKHRISTELWDPFNDKMDIIPQPFWLDKINDIYDIIDTNLDRSDDNYFQWLNIRKILQTCDIYISHEGFNIHPVIAPNLIHEPFKNAKERIYMSATMGSNGDLERTFGIKNVTRLSNKTPDLKAKGSRYFLFPQDVFEAEDILDAVLEAIKMQPRTLILTPSQYLLNHLNEILEENLPKYDIYLDTDTEKSLEDFKKNDKAILLLAGRYEGIDLREEDCRLTIFYDIPYSVGAPEKFMHDRLNANEILNGKLASRIIQGIGRSTRTNEDYSAVMFVGNNIGEYLYSDDFIDLMPPNIASELRFAFEQAEDDMDMEEWISNLKSFYSQDFEWQQGKNYIENKTDKIVKDGPDSFLNKKREVLSEISNLEVQFMYHLIEDDFSQSFSLAEDIIKSLSKVQEFGGYRAWWNYQIASVANKQNNIDIAEEYLNRSVKASINKRWIDVKQLSNFKNEINYDLSEDHEDQINEILEILRGYGDREKQFHKKWSRISDGIKSVDADEFESQLNELGKMLGFNTERPYRKKGSPDGIWNFNNEFIIFEAKTGYEDKSEPIPLKHLEQAHMQNRWVKTNKNLDDSASLINCFISDRVLVEDEFKYAAEMLYLVTHEEIISISNSLQSTLIKIFQEMKTNNEESAKKLLVDSFKKEGYFFNDLMVKFKQKKLDE